MVDERFRQTYDYAQAHGFVGGFPNFHQADSGQGVVYGTILLRSGEWRDVSVIDLGSPPPPVRDVAGMFRAVYDYAIRNGFVAGLPTFHQADSGQGVVYGTILLRSSEAEWRDVSVIDLGSPPPLVRDVEGRFRATYDYTIRNGFVAGFPNFHHADHGQGVVFGTILIKPGAAEWRDVPADVMNMFSWPFEATYTRQQRLTVLERHTFAYSRIRGCGSLMQQQRTDLFDAYRRSSISHIFLPDDPNLGVIASSVVGGSTIAINFNNFFPISQNEQAQTLIHEMMHCAGYNHPKRRDQPNPNPDRPGDGGPYYSTPPLQAEICIAGTQSLRVCQPGPDGTCTICKS
jgi:hypothetical protein